MAKKFAKDADPTITRLLDEGHKVQEDYADLIDRRDSIRTGLRSLRDSGLATEEQSKMIDELYPPRQVKEIKPAKTNTEPVAKAA